MAKNIADEFKKSCKKSSDNVKELKEIPKIDNDDMRMSETGIAVRGKKTFEKVFDYPIQVQYLVRDDNDEVDRIIRIGNDFYKISNDEICSASKFKKFCMKDQKVFRGTDDQLYTILSYLPKAPECSKVDRLGFNKDSEAFFFKNIATKNGQIYTPDKFGLIEIDGKPLFMPYVKSIFDKKGKKKPFRQAERMEYLANPNINFDKWFNALYGAFNVHSILPTCYAIMSLFRDVVFENCNFVPLFYLKGAKGSGKSTLARMLTTIIGYKQHEISLKSPNSAKALPRILSQIINGMTWIDEFHNNALEAILGMLQSAYDGSGYEIADKTIGIETISIEILSTIFLTSNYIPDNEIFFSRCILQQQNNNKFTADERKAYKELEELAKTNLSPISVEILEYRDVIKRDWKHIFDELENKLVAELKDVETRFIANMCTMLTPMVVLLKHKAFFFHGITIDELVSVAINNIREHFELMNENSAIIDFWTTILRLAETGKIREGVHYKFDHENTSNGVIYDKYLYIRFKYLYQEYAKEVGNKAKSKDEIEEQIKKHSSFIDNVKNVKFVDAKDVLEPNPVSIKDNKNVTCTCAFKLDNDLLVKSLGVSLR